MKRLTALLPVLLVASGCVSTQLSTSGDPEFVGKINRLGQTHAATIRTSDQLLHRGRALAIVRDSVSYRLATPNIDSPIVSIPVEQVKAIGFRSRGRGATNGVIAGAALGFGTGAILAAGCDGWMCPTPIQAGVAVALPGILLGAIIGALTATENQFVFIPTRRTASVLQ